MSIRDAFFKISSVLPEVPKPKQKPSLTERLIWTLLAVVLYLLMAQIPLYGVLKSSSSLLFFYQIIFAANIGTLMTLGIGPIVTAGLIAQVLMGSDLIHLDLTNPEDQKFFASITKILTFVFIIAESVFYVLSGVVGTTLSPYETVIVIFQLIIATSIVFLLDQMLQKGWGIGSGISLFILAGISLQIMLDLFSPIPVDGQYFGYIPYAINETIHRAYMNIVNRPANFPDLIGLISTILFALLILYLEGVRIEIPISSSKFKGFSATYPIKLLYVSNIPVILVAALIADFQFFFAMLAKNPAIYNHITWLGTVQNGTFTGGLLYYVSTPPPVPLAFHHPVQVITYSLFVIILSVVFAKLWVDVSGMSAEKAAETIISSDLQIPGFRTTRTTIGSLLNRYIPVVTLFSGLLIGIIAAASTLLNVYGTGIGLLLVIDISISYYQMLAQEQLISTVPGLGGLFE
ncbi:MAG: preprotein translocase subunit SecY [Nitrososphaeria archaeon]|jgi:preprotein translocase subunit SecY